MSSLPDWQPQAHLNLFRLNDCAELNDLREEGMFEVRYDNEVIPFTRIISAYNFYLTLQAEARIFDVTEGEVLLETKKYLRES